MTGTSRLALTLILTFLFCALGSGAESAKPAPEPPEEQPLRFRLMSELLKVSGKALPRGKHCDFNLNDYEKSGPLTIGKWMAWNLSFYQSGPANSIAATCAPAKKAKARCELNFQADSKGESPWSCGFRFDVRLPSHQIDVSTLECTGTC